MEQNSNRWMKPLRGGQLVALQWKQWAGRSSNWLVLLLFAAAGGYGLYQGFSNKQEKGTTIQAFRQEKDSLLQDMVAGINADTLTQTGKAKYSKSSSIHSALWNTKLPSYKLPVNTAIYCIGQSDVFSYYYLFAVENFEMQLLKQTEISNPLRALAGHFDVSFWVIYLLPLLILLFSFNALSAETDSGNWRLIAAQGITQQAWLKSRFWITAAISGGLLAVVIISGTLLNAVVFRQTPTLSDGLFFLTAAVYLFFWLSLFYFIGSLRRTTAWNALVSGVVWIGICLVLPVVVSRVAQLTVPVNNTAISTFSRRPQNPQIEDSKAFATGIIQQLSSKEPKYAKVNIDTTRPAFMLRTYQAWHWLLHRERWPVMQRYYAAVESRQQVTDWSTVLNPAGSTDGLLTALADNDAAAFHGLTEQAEQLHATLQDVMYPALFGDKAVSKNEYNQLPQFRYQRHPLPPSLIGYFVLLSLAAAGLLWVANARLKRLPDGEGN